MSQRTRFRRPAMLSFEDAEKIEGDEDPAAAFQVAMTSARALLGLSDDEFGPDAVENLVRAIASEGVDIVADLWERSPAFTLPGAFWRLYLFNEWYQRDPLLIHERFNEGVNAPFTAGIDDAEEEQSIPDVEAVFARVTALFTGQDFGDLTDLLRECALTMRILASGATFGTTWIRSDKDRLATMVTRRAAALIETANEVDLAADRSEANRLT
ncbi:MAG: hypothetical protein Q4P05_07400 [Actinomycetaceae bacterium]|nr:hypothetical protein [Actinomycetaceae bacterium]